MSQMLEQAIIDAEALKEAALKNAEQSILEKYSKEVKGFVDTLLEQPGEEDELGGELGGMPPTGEPMAGAADEFSDMARADTEGEELCPCPEEEEVVDVDFDALAAQMKSAEEAEMVDREGFAGDELELMGSEEEEELARRDLYEEIEFSEEDLMEILEELTVDIKAVPSGQAGGASNITLEKEMRDIVLAQEGEEEAKEGAKEETVDEKKDKKKDKEKEQLKEAFVNVRKEKQKADGDIGKLLDQNNKLTDLLIRLKDKLEEVNLSNSKLFYTNKTLTSTSLNERQKTKIVEAINKVNSVEEAKVLYETLQSAVGTYRKRMPKSLNEVVTRPSTTLPRRNEAKKSDPISTRWKTLAGIK